MNIHTNISQINQEQWKELVDNSSHASFFQTPEAYDFFATLSFMKPFIYGVSDDNKLVGLICGFVISDGNMLKRFFSRRAIVIGGPLLDSHISNDALLTLLATVRKELNYKSIYVEIRNYTDYSAYKSVFEDAGFMYAEHLNFHVGIVDEESALMQLNSTKRRDVKLTRKSGADWFESKSRVDLLDYYELLVELYKTKVKTPLFPLEFFEKLIQLPNGKLFVVKFEGKVIGGSVCVVLPGRVIYEWFVCGQDGKIKNIFSSTAATWAAIEYGAQNGITRFDMMGAGKPTDAYGVREFKSKFGGELVQHGRFLHINRPLLYKLGKKVVDFYRSTTNTNVDKKVFDDKVQYRILIPTEPKDFQLWFAFVNKHPNGNIFQTPEMYRIYTNTVKFEPIPLLATDHAGNVLGCLLAVIQYQYEGVFGFLSARSIVNGGPLVENDNPKIVDFILTEYNKIVKQKAVFTQFRNSYNLLDLNDSFQKCGYTFESHLNYNIDLSKGFDEVWSHIHEGRKSKIKKALKSGLSVIVIENDITKQQIKEGYEIIKKVYDRADLPLADKQLLVNAAKSNHLVLFMVIYDQKIIGCRFAFKFNTQLYGWYAGSYVEYYSLFPNDLLISETLKWAAENGYSSFDYGGAGNPNKPYGVRSFKAQTGGLLVNYGRYEKIHRPVIFFVAKLGFRFWQMFNRN